MTNMNPPHNNSPDNNPADHETDGDLAGLGAQLRSQAGTPPVSGIAAAALGTKVQRLQRLLTVSTAVGVVAVIALIATVVFPLGARNDPTGSTSNNQRNGTPGDTSRHADAADLVAGLDPEPIDPTAVQLVATVSQFDDCEPLLQQIHEVGAAHVGSYGFGATHRTFHMVGGFAANSTVDALSDESAAFSAPDPVAGTPTPAGETLGTNVIVDGVDEADSIKAVGTLVLDLSTGKLRITDTRGPSIVSELRLSAGEPDLGTMHDNGHYDPPRLQQSYDTMLVDGDHVIVLGTESVLQDPIEGDPSATRLTYQYTTVTFVNIADPANPTVTERARIEGARVSVRRVGSQVRLLTRSNMADLPFVYPQTPNSVEKALYENRMSVATSMIDDWIPHWDRGDGTEQQRLSTCDNVVLPDTFAGVQMTSMIQFPSTGPFTPESMSILAPGSRLTATPDDIVIAAEVWVDPIHQTKDFNDWSTALHRFSFTNDGPTYRGSGQIPGTVRDDFSLSVLSNDAIAAVTVDVVPWKNRNDAKVHVRSLATQTATRELIEVDAFQPADAVIGAAGVRFTGDRLLLATGAMGNIVTSIDLSDPDQLVDLGTIHLPHVASYFHRVNENQVLTIGTGYRMVGERIYTDFVAVLLDVTAEPQILDTWTVERAGSDATYNHHSFLWWPQQSTALLGLDNQDYSPTVPDPPNHGVLLGVRDAQFDPRIVDLQEADLGPRCAPTQFPRDNCDDTGRARVVRMLIVDGKPWAYTTESLEGFDPDSLESVAMLTYRN